MKFAYFGYREWARKILEKLERSPFEIEPFTTPDTEYSRNSFRGRAIPTTDPKKMPDLKPEECGALLFYGWSWILPKDFVSKHTCVCLHPSPLPKYRGGTPIQHQIINGEDKSAVTLFRMSDGMDNGPIYYQKGFSLEGKLSDVFSKITHVGAELTYNLLGDFERGVARELSQDESRATIFKRRKPEDSELKPEQLRKMTARQIHDFVRALQDPYPNAYIVGADGKKVYLNDTKLPPE